MNVPAPGVYSIASGRETVLRHLLTEAEIRFPSIDAKLDENLGL